MATKNLGRVKGLSAYEVANEQGYSGSEAEWLASLKGEKGDRGDRGEQGIQGIQGEQGDKGFSPTAKVEQTGEGIAEVTITDESGTTTATLRSTPMLDETGNRTDATMTQRAITEAVENVEEKVTTLGLKVGELEDDYERLIGTPEKIIDTTIYDERVGVISDGKWTKNSAYRHIIMPVESGGKYNINNQSTAVGGYAFLRQNDDVITGSVPSFCEGYTNRVRLPNGTSTEFTIPSDCNFLYIQTLQINVHCRPTLKTLYQEGSLTKLEKAIPQLKDDITDCQSVILSVETFEEKDTVAGYYATGNFAVGATFNGVINTFGDTQTWRCIKVQVNKSESIIVKTVGGATGRAWCVCNQANKILAIAESGANTLMNPFTYTAEDEAVVLYINRNAAAIDRIEISVKRQKIDVRVANLEKKIKGVGASRISNPKCDVYVKDTVKILDIGNSFSLDPQSYLAEFIAADGLDLSKFGLYRAIRSGGSFKTFVDSWHGIDSQGYEVGKALSNCLDITIVGETKQERLQYAIKNIKWDVIIIHQVSNYSNNPEMWDGDTEGGYLVEFMRILRTYQPNAMIGQLMPHSSYHTSNGYTQNFWEGVCDGVRWLVSNYGMDFVIPVGTAIENLRASNLKTTAIKYGFSRDKHHLAFGLARYVASATYYHSLFGLRFAKSVYESTSLHSITDAERAASDNTYPDESVSVTALNAPIAKMCAILACENMYKIQNPNNIVL